MWYRTVQQPPSFIKMYNPATTQVNPLSQEKILPNIVESVPEIMKHEVELAIDNLKM